MASGHVRWVRGVHYSHTSVPTLETSICGGLSDSDLRRVDSRVTAQSQSVRTFGNDSTAMLTDPGIVPRLHYSEWESPQREIRL